MCLDQQERIQGSQSSVFYTKACLTVVHTTPSALFIQEGISLRCLTALPKRKSVIFFHGRRSKAARDMCICVLVCVCVCVCVCLKLENHLNQIQCSQKVIKCNEKFVLFAIFSVLISTSNFNFQSFSKMNYSLYLKIYFVSCTICMLQMLVSKRGYVQNSYDNVS